MRIESAKLAEAVRQLVDSLKTIKEATGAVVVKADIYGGKVGVSVLKQFNVRPEELEYIKGSFEAGGMRLDLLRTEEDDCIVFDFEVRVEGVSDDG